MTENRNNESRQKLKSAFNQIIIYYFDDVELTHVD